MDVTERLDSFQRRHQWAGAPLATIYKFHDDQGVYLAALIAFYGFLSLFPLLLLFTTILGFVLQNDAGLRTRILDSTLSQFPVNGQRARRSSERSRQRCRPDRQRARGRLRRPRSGSRNPACDECHVGGPPLSPPKPVLSAAAQPRADRHRRSGDDHHHDLVGSRQSATALAPISTGWAPH